jgi:uncharacterized protein YyaL (SSP411 family)
MKNHLKNHSNPYLRQHAENPVHWYPWGEEAFQEAERRDVPIFLSIGYSTCHWCHVMEKESFEDEEVAELLNSGFVSIKLDREERPDIDALYMDAVQLMGKRGGWPLSLFLTPDKVPFYGASYIPKNDNYGVVGLMRLLPRIREVWENSREELLQNSSRLLEALQYSPEALQEFDPQPLIEQAAEEMYANFDPIHGGFSQAPKFPQAHSILFLLSYGKRHNRKDMVEAALYSLEKICLGGIYDHVGFGFHRYSTDGEWLVPHFEKMLYDQAGMLELLSSAYKLSEKPLFKQRASEIILYLEDRLKGNLPYFSAEDADSEGVEGKFYLWTISEWNDAAQDFADLFQIDEQGNFFDEFSKSKTTENIPHLKAPLEKETVKAWEGRRWELYKKRKQRIHPFLDEKKLCDWNGLTLAALAQYAAQVSKDPQPARELAEAMIETFYSQKADEGSLSHSFFAQEEGSEAMLDDYAFFIYGLLKLYGVCYETRYLSLALELAQRVRSQFKDQKAGGYFLSKESSDLIVRKKTSIDGALPSGQSILAWNFQRLHGLTADSIWYEEFEQLLISSAASIQRYPSAHSALLRAVMDESANHIQIVITGQKESAQVLLDFVQGMDVPVLYKGPGDGAVETFAPFTGSMDGKRTQAFLCKSFACELPVSSKDELRALIEQTMDGQEKNLHIGS